MLHQYRLPPGVPSGEGGEFRGSDFNPGMEIGRETCAILSSLSSQGRHCLTMTRHEPSAPFYGEVEIAVFLHNNPAALTELGNQTSDHATPHADGGPDNPIVAVPVDLHAESQRIEQ